VGEPGGWRTCFPGPELAAGTVYCVIRIIVIRSREVGTRWWYRTPDADTGGTAENSYNDPYETVDAQARVSLWRVRESVRAGKFYTTLLACKQYGTE